MANKLDSLIFDIDIDELTAIQKSLEATESQLLAAYNRAVTRTAVTMRKLSSQMIRDEMQVKSMKAMRRRMQFFKLNSGSGMDQLRLWYGLNDMPVGVLKGCIQSRGAVFRPAANGLGTKKYENAFVAKLWKRRSIYVRKGAGRFNVREAKIAISDSIIEDVEDDIFERLPEVFFRHFESDLKGRVRRGLNKVNWHE